jgi:hypothetical protein
LGVKENGFGNQLQSSFPLDKPLYQTQSQKMNTNEMQRWTQTSDELRALTRPVDVLCQIQPPGGKSLLLEPAKMPVYFADPIGFCARHVQTIPERFRAWLIYHEEECHCTGTTRSARRCNAYGPI